MATKEKKKAGATGSYCKFTMASGAEYRGEIVNDPAEAEFYELEDGTHINFLHVQAVSLEERPAEPEEDES